MNKPIARKDNIVVQRIENETLVYDLKENKAFCLNETSALVWELCNGKRTVSNIGDEMSTELRTSINEEFVNLALDQLSKDGLLENDGSIYLEGVSRREVVRKVGFASVVALPIVSSLVAPEAALAQSCVGFDEDCSSASCCAPNVCAGPIDRCCVVATAIRAPGALGGCVPSQGSCDTFATGNCCSGTGTLSPGNPFCSGVTGEACICN